MKNKSLFPHITAKPNLEYCGESLRENMLRVDEGSLDHEKSEFHLPFKGILLYYLCAK